MPRAVWNGAVIAETEDVEVVDGYGEVNRAAAWYYPGPSRRAAPLVGGRIGFWRGVKIEHGDADHRGEHRGLLSRLTGRRP